MKNILSENMQRFGTKNLTESAKKKLIIKSIMETINQHGLQEAVKSALNEEAAFLGTYKGKLVVKNGPNVPSYNATTGAPMGSVKGDTGLLAAYPKGLKFQGGIGYGSSEDGSSYKIVSNTLKDGMLTVNGNDLVFVAADGNKSVLPGQSGQSNIPEIQVDATLVGGGRG